jgi:hypothetical protein
VFLNDEVEIVPMRGHTSGGNSDQTDAETRQ